MAKPADSTVQNILPIQAYFNIDGSFNTFIGQGKPFIVSATESIGIIDTSVAGTFYPTFSPVSSGQVTSLSVTSLKLSFNPDTGVLSAPTFLGYLNGTSNTANNLANGIASQIPYQTGNGSTAFIANGSNGQVLTSNGTSAPSWQNNAASVSVTDNTSSASIFYPLFANQTAGSITTQFTSSTKYQYVPSTGILTATGFSGSGANLTNIPNSALTNSSFTLGNTSIALGSTTTTIAGLSSVTSTTFVGALTGNASTATSATTATTATNATNTAITDNTSSTATWYPTIVSSTSGNLPQTTSSTKLSFVPSTGTLTATNFAGLASSATNVAGGAANQVLYQTGSGATSFITAPTIASTYLSWTGSAFAWATAGGSGMVYPGAGIPNSTGSAWGTSYSTTGSGTVVALATSPTLTTPAITGGTIDNTVIGGTTPAAGTFTTITGQTEVLKGTGTNLLQRSQALATSPWTNFGTVTATNNNAVAPDSTTTATTLAFSANSGTYQNITGIGLLTYTFSVYLRAASPVTVSVVLNTNLSDPVTLSASVTTSWQRFTISKTTASGTSSIASQISVGGTPATVEAWGAQLELGSVTNTYIPTTTTAVYGTPTLSFSGVAGLGLQSDGSLYVSPAGTGALQAQATTSSTVGGNARGANAVDWQTARGAASQVASAGNSVLVGGQNNTVSASRASVLGGLQNNNSSYGGVITGGESNSAGSGNFAFVGSGITNTSAGFFNFIGNGQSNSGTSASAVTTQATTSFTSGSTAVTLSGSNASIKVGQLVIGTGVTSYTYVAAISGTSLTLSQNANATGTPTLSFYTPHGVVVGGGNNQATGSYSFIGGGGDAGTAANRNVASGDWSFVGGGRGNQATGVGSFIGGGGLQTGFSGGNTASGEASTVAGGFGNNAANIGVSIVGGYQNFANGAYSTAIGRYAATRAISGNVAISPCSVPISANLGNSQVALLVLARQTTDATATVLTSDAIAASGTNQVILPNNSAYYFTGEVVSGVTGGGNTKGWTISGLIKRGANAGATTLVGSTVTSLYADAGAATWTIALSADTTNGGLAVTFTGQAATTIRTVCQIRTTEMTY